MRARRNCRSAATMDRGWGRNCRRIAWEDPCGGWDLRLNRQEEAADEVAMHSGHPAPTPRPGGGPVRAEKTGGLGRPPVAFRNSGSIVGSHFF